MRARFLVVLAPLMLLPAVGAAVSPEGWTLAGNDPSSYMMDRDSVETYAGKPSGRLMSVCESTGSDSTMGCKGFGTIMLVLRKRPGVALPPAGVAGAPLADTPCLEDPLRLGPGACVLPPQDVCRRVTVERSRSPSY